MNDKSAKRKRLLGLFGNRQDRLMALVRERLRVKTLMKYGLMAFDQDRLDELDQKIADLDDAANHTLQEVLQLKASGKMATAMR